jgi:hypothetical protein
MKQALLKTMFIFAVTVIAFASVEAQITIKLPNIKKLVKPDIKTDNNTNVTTDVTNTTTTTDVTNNNSSTNWWIDYQIGEIGKYKQQLTSWNPANQVFPRPNSSDDYISLALSKKERNDWVQSKKLAPDAKLDAALDGLKDLLYKRLPEYTINPRSFNNRNAAEEKLVLAEMSDVPGLKVYKIGFNQANWLIETNNLGIPKARYKHGLVYGRRPDSEDPFCRVWYVNVVQPYSGGGTYGATEARYIEKEYIACPAGQ